MKLLKEYSSQVLISVLFLLLGVCQKSHVYTAVRVDAARGPRVAPARTAQASAADVSRVAAQRHTPAAARRPAPRHTLLADYVH